MIGLGLSLPQVALRARLLAGAALPLWILASGTWNDAAPWTDTQPWKDAA